MATVENSTWISGRTSRSSFNGDWTGTLKLDCYMWQIAEVLPSLLDFLAVRDCQLRRCLLRRSITETLVATPWKEFLEAL
jgi:hypothetical protein